MLLPVCILMLTGCSANDSFPEIQAAADSDADIRYNGTEYRCHIRYIDNATSSVTLLSPEEISGLTFTRSSGEYTCSLGKLLCKGEDLPDNSLPKEIFRVYDSIANTDPEPLVKHTDGSCEFRCGEIKLTTDSSGRPVFSDSKSITISIQNEPDAADNDA